MIPITQEKQQEHVSQIPKTKIQVAHDLGQETYGKPNPQLVPCWEAQNDVAKSLEQEKSLFQDTLDLEESPSTLPTFKEVWTK